MRRIHLKPSALFGIIVAAAAFALGLSTPQSKYERDRPVLEELLKSWCLQPIE